MQELTDVFLDVMKSVPVAGRDADDVRYSIDWIIQHAIQAIIDYGDGGVQLYVGESLDPTNYLCTVFIHPTCEEPPGGSARAIQPLFTFLVPQDGPPYPVTLCYEHHVLDGTQRVCSDEDQLIDELKTMVACLVSTITIQAEFASKGADEDKKEEEEDDRD